MDLFGKSPRPTFNSELKYKLAVIVGKKVYEWCNHETDLEDCVSSAKKVLEYSYNDDGFQLAKDFEDEGFGSDSELVEILDDVSYEVIKILKDAIEKWVIDDNIEPQFNIGDIVKYKRRGKEIIGEIARIDRHAAQYLTYVEGSGQIKGQSGHLINYEDCELCIRN